MKNKQDVPVETARKECKSRTEGSIHDGHRDRLRKRYIASGMEDFAPHEVLEMLLTYSIPREDVNPRAHALIEHFGSLPAVLDATPEELREVPGIGPGTALYLTMLPAVCRRYMKDKCDVSEPLNTVAKVSEYLHALYQGISVERVYLLLFDNGMHLIEAYHVEDGTVNSAQPSIRKMAERVFTKHAACVVLAHNHPHGIAVPSCADYEETDNVSAALQILEIPLVEHFIVTDNACAPICRGRRGTLRSTVNERYFGESFYLTFYGETPKA